MLIWFHWKHLIWELNLKFNDVTGCWAKYVMSKQRGENMVNKFNVPLNYVQYLTQYCDVWKEADLYIGRLFKSYRIRV